MHGMTIPHSYTVVAGLTLYRYGTYSRASICSTASTTRSLQSQTRTMEATPRVPIWRKSLACSDCRLPTFSAEVREARSSSHVMVYLSHSSEKKC